MDQGASPTTATPYTVTATDLVGTQASATVGVDVLPAATCTARIDESTTEYWTLFATGSTGNAPLEYQWDFSWTSALDVPFGGQTSISVPLEGPVVGEDSVTLTVRGSDGCTDSAVWLVH